MMSWTKSKISVFKIFQYISLSGAILTIIAIGDYNFNPDETNELLEVFIILLSLTLIIQFFAYSIDFLIILLRKLLGKQIEIKEIYLFIITIIVGFIWFFILGKTKNNLSLNHNSFGLIKVAFVIATGINYWKLKIINGHNYIKYKQFNFDNVSKIYESVANWIKK